MIRKLFIISATVLGLLTNTSIIPAMADNNTISDLGTSEYGYIFTTKQKPDVELMDCNVDIISDKVNIYHVDTLAELEKISKYYEIDRVAEDVKIELFDYPDDANDPYYSTQWGLNVCNVPYFWQHNITGEGVKVGIVDTGIYLEHEDLRGLRIENGINICAMLEDNADKMADTTDTNGHGTGVTGVLAASVNNGVGISGITDRITVTPIKIYDETSSYSLSVGALLKGIEYAALNGCDVINLSVGFSGPSKELIDITNELIQSVISNNVIVVASTGNHGTDTNVLEYPVACDGVVGVASVKKSGDVYTKSSFSTANKSVYVSAPGSNVTGLKSDINGYEYKNGTSFSAPIVTGLAVGLKQLYPDITINQFMTILRETSTDLDAEGYDTNTGYGLVNFKKAYDAAVKLKEYDKPLDPGDIGPETKADICTYLSLDREKNRVVCRIENTTDDYLAVTGIIAAYDGSTLKEIRTVNGLFSGGQTIYLDNANDYSTVKFMVWDNLMTMKPYDNAVGAELDICNQE